MGKDQKWYTLTLDRSYEELIRGVAYAEGSAVAPYMRRLVIEDLRRRGLIDERGRIVEQGDQQEKVAI
jgi:hypothetical protein